MAALTLSESKRKLAGFACVCFIVLWTLASAFRLVEPVLSDSLFFFDGLNGKTACADFVRLYVAGKIAAGTEAYRAYEPAVQLAAFNQVSRPRVIETDYFLEFPPHVFILMMPISILPMATAYWLWSLFSVCFGYMATFVVSRRMRGFSLKDTNLLFLSALVSLPSILALRLGQTDWLMAPALLAFYAALERKRDIACGAFLALATVKPQYALFFFVAVLASGRYKILASASACLSVFFLLSAAILGIENTVLYPQIVTVSESIEHTNVFPRDMLSIRGALSHIMPTAPALKVSFGFMLAGLAATFFVSRAAARAALPAAWPMALTALLSMVVSPHMMPYDALLTLLPAVATIESISLFQMMAIADKDKRLFSILLFLYPAFTWIVASIPFNLGHWNWLYLIWHLALLILAVRIYRQSLGLAVLA